MDQARRCTSYPEYQCLPADEPTQQGVSAKHNTKGAAQTSNAADPAASSVAGSDTGVQTASAK